MSFAGLANQRILIESWEGQDGYGSPIFGASKEYRGRIVSLPKRVLGDRGEEITSNTQIYLDTTEIISPKDRVTLPAEYIPNQPPILRVGPVRGATEGHHTVIFL